MYISRFFSYTILCDQNLGYWFFLNVRIRPCDITLNVNGMDFDKFIFRKSQSCTKLHNKIIVNIYVLIINHNELFWYLLINLKKYCMIV